MSPTKSFNTDQPYLRVKLSFLSACCAGGLILEGPLKPGELLLVQGESKEKVAMRRMRLQASSHVQILEDVPVNRSVLLHPIHPLGTTVDGAKEQFVAAAMIG